MSLRFLGMGSAYNPAMKNTSAILPVNRALVLFDCGETVFETLISKNLLHKYDEFIVLITHFHSDHIGSLGSLISYCFCRLKKRVFIVYPTSDICTLLKIAGVPCSMYEYSNSVPTCYEDRLSISAIPVQHDPLIPCFGYIVTTNDNTFFYGGDSNKIPDAILDLLIQGKIDTIYQDTSYKHLADSNCHGTLEGLCEQVPKGYRSKIICTHFDHDFIDKVHEAGFCTPELL